MRKLWRLTSTVITIVCSCLFAVPAMAATAPTASKVSSNPLYVGNVWTTSGTYNDSLAQEDAAQGLPSSEEIIADIGDSTANFLGLELNGYMTDGVVQLEFLTNQGSVISTLNVSYSQFNTYIAAPAGAWEIIMHEYEPTPGVGGNAFITSTWGEDMDTGLVYQTNFATPSWAYTAPPTGSTQPAIQPPPDWTQIEQEIGHQIWAEAPPIPAPPSSTVAVTAPTAITSPAISNAPSVPNITANTPDFTSSPAISVDFSGSQSFAISDPVASLPHDPIGTMPIPGSAPALFTPSPGTVGASEPVPSVSAPTTAITCPSPHQQWQTVKPSGPTPVIGQPVYGTGAIPSASAPQPYVGPVPSGSAATTGWIGPTWSGATIPNVSQPMYLGG